MPFDVAVQPCDTQVGWRFLLSNVVQIIVTFISEFENQVKSSGIILLSILRYQHGAKYKPMSLWVQFPVFLEFKFWSRYFYHRLWAEKLLGFFILVKKMIYRYEMAEECADDDDAKVGIRKLRKSILEELKMHDSFVQVCIKTLHLHLFFVVF